MTGPPPPSWSRRILVALGCVIVLLAAALWIVPRLLDWESWRPQLAELATARLGRTVHLDGPITLVLLPQPRVEAQDVSVGPAADGLSITARGMRLRLDLGALLACAREVQRVLGRPLGSHLLTAGPVEWNG